MALQPNEYNIGYFDGRKAEKLGLPRHPAGYSRYENTWAWNYHRIQPFIKEFSISDYISKKALELGCAKGFLVKGLRDLGVNAFGIDVSEYASVETGVGYTDGYIWQADARTGLSTIKNREYDLVYSWGFFECLDENEIADMITEINRMAKQQIHIFHSDGSSDYYLMKSLSWWVNQGFKKGTVLAEFPDWARMTVQWQP